MMSLERLEAMNRKAILWAFPLLTLGLIVGIALQLHQGNLLNGLGQSQNSQHVGLWLVFAILIYVRYGAHARGRQVALLSLLAFADYDLCPVGSGASLRSRWGWPMNLLVVGCSFQNTPIAVARKAGLRRTTSCPPPSLRSIAATATRRSS